MKRTSHKFVILESEKEVFWVRNLYHGYGPDNRQVYDCRFSTKLGEATLFNTEKEAKKVLDIFDNYDFVQTDSLKVNGQALVIHPVELQYESSRRSGR